MFSSESFLISNSIAILKSVIFRAYQTGTKLQYLHLFTRIINTDIKDRLNILLVDGNYEEFAKMVGSFLQQDESLIVPIFSPSNSNWSDIDLQSHGRIIRWAANDDRKSNVIERFRDFLKNNYVASKRFEKSLSLVVWNSQTAV